MMRPDWLILCAILIAGALTILCFTFFFAFVFLDDDEIPRDGVWSLTFARGAALFVFAWSRFLAVTAIRGVLSRVPRYRVRVERVTR